MEKTCYTAKEVAQMLGVALPTIYGLCNDPSFPSVRISPRRVIIPADGLRRWLEERSMNRVV